MALDFAAIITRPNVVHKQQVKHNINTFKLYIRNESLKIKIIRSLNYFLLLKLTNLVTTWLIDLEGDGDKPGRGR